MRILDGQRALVTGGSSGIGAAVCRAYCAVGARVGVNYATSAGDAEKVAAEIRAAGGDAITLQADVSDEAQVRAMFGRFIAEYGGVDIVVANAGIQKDSDFAGMTLE